MAVEKQSEQGISMLEVAYKVVQATMATMAAYRAARSALKAWRAIVTMIRGDASGDDDN
ncbi:MAG: hypothetical protein J4N95_06305 [Chloroflexi bacterium]|nr:hypothetical protein [Chloroflexota bacterium]